MDVHGKASENRGWKSVFYRALPDMDTSIHERMLVTSSHERLHSLEGFELEEYKYNLELAKEEHKAKMLAKKGYGYWLDNCGDGTWYCEHCLQPECGKREAKCSLLHEYD